jgi:ABC-type transport system involved in multi-copper enzyme maturation permease subunit
MRRQIAALAVLAQNTFRGLVRRQSLLNVAILGVGLVLLALVVSSISYGFPARILRSLGLSGVGIALNLLALLLGASLVSEEMQQRTLYLVLTRPVGRGSYVVGRFLGAAAVVACASVGFYGVLLAVLWGVEAGWQSADALAVGFMTLEATVLLAFATLMSCLTTPLLATGLGLGFWVISASIDDVRRLLASAEGIVVPIIEAARWVVPSFHVLNYRNVAVYGDPVNLGGVAAAAGHGLTYAVALVALAAFALSRRELG